MRISVAIGVVMALMITPGVLPAASTGSRTLKSYTEAGGTQHPATAKVSGPASVSCTSVGGANASCYVTGPGVEKQVPKGNNVFTVEAGTVTLICNGTGPLTCEAQIDLATAAKKDDDK